MKRIKYTLAIALLTAISAFTAYAQQNLRSAYFLDGYTYNYKLNPAMAPERGFFAVPIVGNFGVGAETNLAVSTLLYPTGNGNMTTFLNSSIDDKVFLDKLNTLNNLNVSLNESLLAMGFRTGKSFHTIDLSLKADVSASVPKDLFAFMKTGSSSGATAWDISRTGVRADSRLELAYGYSRSISDRLRVGARAKMLIGILRADAVIDELNLQMTGKEWSVTAHGTAEVSSPVPADKAASETDPNLLTLFAAPFEVIEDIGEGLEDYYSKASVGFAIDLGASFDFLDYFTASVSVLDLGFIGWNETTTAVMPGGKWSFGGFGNMSFEDEGGFDAEIDRLGEELENMLKMEITGQGIKKSNNIAATVHAGLEARMPFYERLTFGLLGTQRVNGIYSWTEGRLSANLAPTNWFSLAGSYAVSNFGNSVGGVANIHLPGLNIYAGLDSFLPLMNVTPQYIPIDSMNTNLTFGMTLTFGKAEGRYRK